MMASLFVWLVVPAALVSGAARLAVLGMMLVDGRRRVRRDSLLRWNGRLFL